MAQKNATPSRRQQDMIRKAGYDPRFWVVVEEHSKSMIIKNRFTGEIKLVNK